MCLLILSASRANAQKDFIDFTADPNKHNIELRLLDKSGKPIGSFERLKKELDYESKDLLFAMNAGIYMQNQMPLGLYIENGKTYRKLNTRKNLYGNFYLTPNGVFLITEGKPHIIKTESFQAFSKEHKIQYATQSGPLLLINDKYNQSLNKYDKNKLIRNAICVTAKNEVNLSISKMPVNFTELSEHLRALKCNSALYLDGTISGIYRKGMPLRNNPPYGVLIAVTLLKPN